MGRRERLRAYPIKRKRRTKAGLEQLDLALADIVAEIQPATVRQVFYQAVVRGLVPKDEAKGALDELVYGELSDLRRQQPKGGRALEART